jgi:hypothetical protein
MGYLRLANYKHPHNFSKLVLAALPLEVPNNPPHSTSATGLFEQHHFIKTGQGIKAQMRIIGFFLLHE